MAGDDDVYVVGGIILLAMLTKSREAIAWGEGWHMPVPDLVMPDGTVYPAVVTSGFKADRHRGIDIMYRRKGIDDRIAEFPPRKLDARGAKQHALFFAPIDTPVLAAKRGRIWSTVRIPTGWMVVIDHGRPWATAYHHLDTITVPRHVRGMRIDGAPAVEVEAGEQIGTMGHNPNTDRSRGAVDGELLRHLHFEPWYKGGDHRFAQDPAGVIGQWGRSTWTL